MSDGVKRMFEDTYEKSYRSGVEKIANKKPEDIYLLLKDIQSDLQALQYDERLVMTRNQFASLNRITNVVRDLLA